MANSLYLRISDTKNVWNQSEMWSGLRPGWPGARSTGAVVEVADSNTLMTLHRMQNVIRLWKNWSDSAWLPSWSKPVCLSPVKFAIHELDSHLSGRITLLFLTKHCATCRTSICMAQVTGLSIETQKFPTGRKMHLHYCNLREKLTLSSQGANVVTWKCSGWSTHFTTSS